MKSGFNDGPQPRFPLLETLELSTIDKPTSSGKG